MATTLQDQVKAYVSDFANADLLNAGAKVVVDLLPVPIAQKHSKEIALSTNGTDVSGYRVLSAKVGNYIAQFIPHTFVSICSDQNSIHYASSRSPRVYYKDGKLYPLPSATGAIEAVKYPIIALADESISDFPVDFVQAVVLYAGSNAALKKAETILLATNSLTDYGQFTAVLSFTGINVPDPIDIPDYVYEDASASSITLGTITLPSSNSLDITSYLTTATPPTNSWTFMGSANLPSLPSAPNLSVEAIDVTTASLTKAITELDTYFTSLDNATTGYINGVEDVELANMKISEMQMKLQEVKTELDLTAQEAIENARASNEAKKMNVANAYKKSLDNYSLSLERFARDLSSWQALLGKQVQEAQLNQQAEMLIYKTQFDIAVSNFNKDLEVYRNDVAKVFKTVELGLQKSIQEAQLATDVSQKNKWNKLQTSMALYKDTLEKYTADLNSYQLQVNTKITEYKALLDAYQTKANIAIQAYATNIQKIDSQSKNYLALADRLRAEFNSFMSMTLGLQTAKQGE